MALITDKNAPKDVPTTDALDGVRADLAAEETPAAYLSFGSTPNAVDDPPSQGEVRTWIVRAYTKDEHGPLERGDGEIRYTRTLKIITAWEQGKPEPPEPDGQTRIDDPDQGGDES